MYNSFPPNKTCFKDATEQSAIALRTHCVNFPRIRCFYFLQFNYQCNEQNGCGLNISYIIGLIYVKSKRILKRVILLCTGALVSSETYSKTISFFKRFIDGHRKVSFSNMFKKYLVNCIYVSLTVNGLDFPNAITSFCCVSP